MSAVRGGPAPKQVKPAVAGEVVARVEEALSPDELKARALSMIAEGEDEGIKLGTMAEALGLESWRDLVPVTRELIEEGNVEKEGSLYFAT